MSSKKSTESERKTESEQKISNDCQICTDKYNRSTRKPIVCGQCQESICLSCCKEYIISTPNKPHCMFCKVAWNYEFLLEKIPHVWITSTFKEWEEQQYFEFEKSLLPATMDLAQERQRQRTFEKEWQKLRDKFAKISSHQHDIHNIIYQQGANMAVQVQMVRDSLKDLNQELAKMSFFEGIDLEEYTKSEVGTKKAKTAFIKPCPADGCKGFLSTKWICGICNTRVCNNCFQIKSQLETNDEKSNDLIELDEKEEKADGHVCKAEDVQTAELIKKDSKDCPGCGVSIFKIEGCFAPETEILMYDGSICRAESIQVGNKLLGDDGCERTVLRVFTGSDEMYDVHQSNGLTYRVNSKHTLALKNSTGEQVFILTEEWNSSLTSELKGWRSENETRSTIRVESVGHGRYVGFEVDGNHLFVLPDFTVVRNCNQMFCTNCKTCWNWSTRAIINGNIHNPHFFEWQQQRRDEETNNTSTMANRGCVWVMGEQVDIQELKRVIIQHNSSVHTQANIDMYMKVRNFVIAVGHIRDHYNGYGRTQLDDDIKLNEEHRVRYILGDISEPLFRANSWTNYVNNRLSRALREVVQLLWQVGHEYVNELYSDIRGMQMSENKKRLNKLEDWMTKIRKFVIFYNRTLNEVYNKYKCGRKMLIIDPLEFNWTDLQSRVVNGLNDIIFFTQQ